MLFFCLFLLYSEFLDLVNFNQFGPENTGPIVDKEIAEQAIAQAEANTDAMEITDVPGDGGIESLPEQRPEEGDNIETNPVVDLPVMAPPTPIKERDPKDNVEINPIIEKGPDYGKFTTPITEKKAGDNIEKSESGSDVASEITEEIYNTHETASNKGYPGIKLTPKGNPDFSGTNYLYPVKDGQKNIVKIKMQGSYYQDYKHANQAGGFPGAKAPENFTWHHLDDYDPKTNETTMQLVQTGSHEATYTHSGSVSQYKKHNPDHRY